MPRSRRPLSQAWKTFLDNHVSEFVSVDFFTLPIATFRVLFVLVILAHRRRSVVHFSVTEHPTAAGPLSKSEKLSPKTERQDT